MIPFSKMVILSILQFLAEPFYMKMLSFLRSAQKHFLPHLVFIPIPIPVVIPIPIWPKYHPLFYFNTYHGILHNNGIYNIPGIPHVNNCSSALHSIPGVRF